MKKEFIEVELEIFGCAENVNLLESIVTGGRYTIENNDGWNFLKS